MKKIVLSILFMFMAAGMAFAQSDLQVLAVVKLNKSESITVKQLKARSELYEKQVGRKLSVDERKQALESLIYEKLMLQAAAKAGVNIPDSTVDQYFIQSMSQQLGVNLSEKELNELIQKSQGVSLDEFLKKQIGMNTSEYKTYLKNQLVIQTYVTQSKQAELQQVGPTDEEIRTFYESNKSSFVWNDMVKAFLVVVDSTSNSDTAKNKINDLRNKYIDKKLSEEQAVAQSKIDGSGYQAGEMLLPKTEACAASLGMSFQTLSSIFSQKEGFVSDVIETPKDFRFMVVIKKFDAKMLSLSDVVQPDTTITVYDYIKQNLATQKAQQYIQLFGNEMAKALYTDANVEKKKEGAALDKLLNWGE